MVKKSETFIITWKNTDNTQISLKVDIDDLGDSKSLYESNEKELFPLFSNANSLKETICNFNDFYGGHLLNDIQEDIPNISYKDISEISVMYIDYLGAQGVYYYSLNNNSIKYEGMFGHPVDNTDNQYNPYDREIIDNEEWDEFMEEEYDVERMDELYDAFYTFLKSDILSEVPDTLSRLLKSAENHWEPDLPHPIFYLVSFLLWEKEYPVTEIKKMLKSVGATDEENDIIFRGPTDMFF